ncbi:MAG: S9 family peptidase [Actinobacteria bacterium]|nr:S9 family peptidase [Actinomycetota bacterium]
MRSDRVFHLFTCLFLILILAVGVLGLCGCGGAESAGIKEPSREPVEAIPDDRKMTYNDVLYGEYATNMAISPDGKSVAWIKEFGHPGMETRADNVFLTSLEDGATEQITSFEESIVEGINWSPDGTALGFETNAPVPDGSGGGDTAQVWLWRPEEGSLGPVTSVESGVESFDWKDSGTVLFTSEIESEDADSDNPDDDTIRVTDYCSNPTRLFEMQLAGGEPEQLTDNDDRIIRINVSPDGGYIFYMKTKSKMDDIVQTYSGEIPFTNHILDLDSGREVQIFDEIVRNGDTAWARDSKTLYAVDMQVSEESLYVYNAKVRTYDTGTGEEELIDVDWERGLELMFPFGLPNDPVQPVEDGFLAFAADGCNPKVVKFTRTGGGWKKEIMEGEHQGNIFLMDVSDDGGTICYDHSSASKPPQLYTAGLDGNKIESPAMITGLNPAFNERSFTRCETIQWEGALGDPVEGLLFYPSGYEPGKKYPLVLVIHGGPFECDKDRWQTYQWIDPYHILSQKGAFVLAPNYHGSTGYGENSMDFSEPVLNGGLYDVVTGDIENGVDWLIDLGLADEKKMGTVGWSCGSMISNALIATDQRFKAASCGAGGAEWVSLWGQSMFGDILVPELIGADPVENPGLYKDPSLAPFYNAEDVETPVIMFQGSEDINVAPDMTWITFRGIQKHSDVPTELYIFPGEGHVLEGLAHQRSKLEKEQAWLDKHLF